MTFMRVCMDVHAFQDVLSMDFMRVCMGQHFKKDSA